MEQTESIPETDRAARRRAAAWRSLGPVVWRGPREQPAWARPALLAIAALAAVLYAWNIADAGLSPFYSMSVKSMSVSWKALLYGAADPRATITIDKLAGSFVPQALSARIFGYHAWSLALPQVVEGVVSVLVIYRVVRRWITGLDQDADAAAGAAGGLLAAAILAFTPIAASMFEHSMEDGALTLCLVLAADRYQYAVMHGRLRSLLCCGVWVGLGFQAKMLEAWLILPALAVGYLALAPLAWRRRLMHACCAGAVTLLVSLSWPLLYALTPAADRPYVDGSTDNNAFSMVFGYNGLDRFGVHVPGSIAPENIANLRAALTRLGAPPFLVQDLRGIGVVGWGKLFGERIGPQISWLLPFALIVLAAGLWRLRRRPRTDPARGGFVFWGLWLLVVAVVYSAMSIPHAAYLSILAPPLAALSAAGIVLFRRTRLLAVAVLVEAAWTVVLARHYPGFLPWLTPLAVVLALLGAVSLLLPRLARTRSATAAGAVAAAAILLTPFAWAFSTFDTAYSGSAVEASAGPDQNRLLLTGTGPLMNMIQSSAAEVVTLPTSMNPARERLVDYVDAHGGASTEYAFATDSWLTAEPYVDGAGIPVLPMGGFSGEAPEPTLAQAQQLVHSGKLRFFLLDRPGTVTMSILFGGSSGAALAQVDAWVRGTCSIVPPADYGAGAGAGTAGSPLATVLYDCGAPSGGPRT